MEQASFQLKIFSLPINLQNDLGHILKIIIFQNQWWVLWQMWSSRQRHMHEYHFLFQPHLLSVVYSLNTTFSIFYFPMLEGSVLLKPQQDIGNSEPVLDIVTITERNIDCKLAKTCKYTLGVRSFNL